MVNGMRFFICSCAGEALLVEPDKDCQIVEISLWARGYGGGKLSWRERLRFIKNILITGEPYHDQVVLSYDEVKKLADYLLETIKTDEKKSDTETQKAD